MIVVYGLDLMLAIFDIVQGIVSTIMTSAGFGESSNTVLPQELITTIESCGFFESIPLWAVTLIRWITCNSVIICNDNECIW